jgi:hypothetical protein
MYALLNNIDDNYWFYYPDLMLKFKKTYYI